MFVRLLPKLSTARRLVFSLQFVLTPDHVCDLVCTYLANRDCAQPEQRLKVAGVGIVSNMFGDLCIYIQSVDAIGVTSHVGDADAADPDDCGGYRHSNVADVVNYNARKVLYENMPPQFLDVLNQAGVEMKSVKFDYGTTDGLEYLTFVMARDNIIYSIKFC